MVPKTTQESKEGEKEMTTWIFFAVIAVICFLVAALAPMNVRARRVVNIIGIVFLVVAAIFLLLWIFAYGSAVQDSDLDGMSNVATHFAIPR